MAARIFLWLSLLIPLFLCRTVNFAQACFACWAGYGPGEERLNKPLADLRLILNMAENHQMMVGALNVLAAGGSTEALPDFREKAGQ